MKSGVFKKLTLVLMLMACLCWTVGCGSSDQAEEATDDAAADNAAAQTEAAEQAVPDPLGVEFDIATAEDSPEWVTKLKEAADAEQLFVVAGIGKTTAYVSMHQKDADGNWKQIFTTPGYIGKMGLGKTKEGDAMTPVGDYKFNYAFGISPDPGCTAFEYQQVTEDDYWSGDQREGYHYNEMVSIKDYPDLNTEDSEHIVDYNYHYQYCMNISWNDDGTPGKGSAIFLHCLGPNKPYTGGCVAIPEQHVVTALKNVQKDCVVVIDSLETLGPDLWNEWEL